MKSSEEIYAFVNELRDGHIKTNQDLQEKLENARSRLSRLSNFDKSVPDVVKEYAKDEINSIRKEIHTRIHVVDNLNHIINFITSEKEAD